MEKLLFEIGTEEIPAKFMPGILKQLKELAAAKMQELRIPFEDITVYGTPRRMAFIAAVWRLLPAALLKHRLTLLLKPKALPLKLPM